jgi:phage host-nuclease inhibitor protein Gam
VTDAELWEQASQPGTEVPDELLDLLVAELGERAHRFAVEDEGSAAWVVDKLLAYDERAGRLKEQFLAMIKAIEADKARFERRFLPELEAWFDQQPRRGKTLALLTGTLTKRTVPAAPTIVDEAKVTAWAGEHLTEAFTIVQKLDTSAVRNYVRETGEVVPGVEIRPARESFSVSGLRPAKEV